MRQSDVGTGYDAAVLRSRGVRNGDALAVIIEGAAATSDVRIVQAQDALRVATDRPDIVLGLRPSGRPRLDAPYPELAVSLSHREGVLLAAFSPTRVVGADIEFDTPGLDARLLAQDHFANSEAAALAGLDAVPARDMFLRLWVAKEAALKTTGRGIHDGLAEPDFTPHLFDLVHDGIVFAVAAGDRVPALDVAVACHVLADGRRVYLGLARQVSP